MSELHLYDFDGTLFRSPHEPAVWDGQWWNDVRSLIPPCVPQKPGADWWVNQTVSSAKQSISDPDVFAMMITGRNANSGLRFRVPELLKQRGLNFDEVHLTPVSSTLGYKKKLLGNTLGRYPLIDTVRMWDDRPSHLRAFAQVAEKMGIDPENIHATQVRAKSKDPECEEDSPAGGGFLSDPPPIGDVCRYVGVFLDASSKAALSHAFPFAHNKIKNDHVTLCLGPALGGNIAEGALDLLGTKVRMKVIGYAEDEDGQAVVVSVPPGLISDASRIPHVTLSISDSVQSKYSNTLLRKGWERVRGPAISGVIDMFPRSMRRQASAVRVAFLHSRLGRSG